MQNIHYQSDYLLFRNEDQFILEALQQSDSLSLSEDALQSLRIKLKQRHLYEVRLTARHG